MPVSTHGPHDFGQWYNKVSVVRHTHSCICWGYARSACFRCGRVRDVVSEQCHEASPGISAGQIIAVVWEQQMLRPGS